MSDSTAIIRALVIYGIVLPVAILLGYLLVNLPDLDTSSVFVVSLVLSILCLPLFLKWQHQLLYMSWNTSALIFFLPGHPELWLFMALASFVIIMIQRALSPESLMNPVWFVLCPALFILMVVIATAYLNGGIHLGSLGSESLGGRKYLYMIAAVIGFIAMTSLRIPENKTNFYIGAFFLGALTNIFGDLIYFAGSLGSSFSFILYVFPAELGQSYMDSDAASFRDPGVYRDYGLTVASTGILFYILARFGIRDLLQGGVVRLLCTLVVVLGCLVGGFRSMLVLILLICFIMFWMEGLFRSKYVLVPLAALMLCLPLAPYADRLPLSIQRTLSVIPIIKVSPEARLSAQGSSEWRIEMWKTLLPQVPHYFWLGKGFESNTSEFISALITQSHGIGSGSETAAMSGDYHNGPLSVIIPFGIWGVIGWIWFLAAGLRALYLNHRYGPARLKTVNTFLLALFLARIIMFLFVFGSSYSDLALFAGHIALSLSLNGGVRKAVQPPVRATGPIGRKFQYPARFAPGLLR
jgi:O-Antigen ligase